MPRIKWEALRNEVVERRFSAAAEEKIGWMEAGREDSTRWTEIAEKLVEAAKEQVENRKSQWRMNG